MSGEFRGGAIPSREGKKAIPDSIKNLGKFTQIFSFIPREKPIISAIFEERKRETISTELSFESTAPVMEALSLHLQRLYKEAFDEKGEMLNYDKVLDIHGILLFLMKFYDSANAGGHAIKEENLILLEDSLADLNKYMEQDPYSEE